MITCLMLTTHPRRAQYLPDALKAYRQQTHADRELLVINDGDTLLSHAPDVRVINLPSNRGSRWTIGEKRNVGVREADGDRIAIWDDDDLSLPHRLSSQAAFDADVVLANSMFVADENLRLLGDCERTGRPVQPSAMLSRNAMVAAGGYPVVDVFEDQALLEKIRYLVRGHIVTIPADWYVIRRHGSNTTQSYNDAYAVCAAHDPEVDRAQALVDAVRAGPGGEDVS